MTTQFESYNGTILNIDCRDDNISRIKLKYSNSEEEGFEIVRFELPDSYIGRTIQVNNSTWRTEEGFNLSRQEIITVNGLEMTVIQSVRRLPYG